MSQDPYLPPGCSMSDIEAAQGNDADFEKALDYSNQFATQLDNALKAADACFKYAGIDPVDCEVLIEGTGCRECFVIDLPKIWVAFDSGELPDLKSDLIAVLREIVAKLEIL